MLAMVVKTLHVLAATLFFGAGLMSAYYKLRADRSKDLRVVAWCQQEIVRADWYFTVPSALALPATGLYLAWLYGLPWETGWLWWGVGGYLAAAVCWLPAARLQLRMRALAERALAEGGQLPPQFHRANRLWFALGIPAFLATAFTVWMMVAKWD
ncbi:MAG: DUF2269 domain-containing protein [Myxococcales bacterium]|nr:DUF2269 domain-containing protein [Myxococcales bacterium]